MNEQMPTRLDVDATKNSNALVDRMDPAIGEASTVMGAMMTELLRRTLRGGVQRIGDELDGFVADKVDSTLAERTPAIEQAAADVAENTARKAATEVAVEEVQNLEKRTTQQIEESEKRARAEIAQQVEAFVERSRKGTAVLNERLKTIETKLGDEVTQRQAGQAALNGELQQKNTALLQVLSVQNREHQDSLRKIRDLLKRNEELSERVTELERPRGLRGLFAKIFGRRKKPKPAAKEPVPEPEIAE